MRAFFGSVLWFYFFFFFFNDTATTEIYTLSLHDALPILCSLGMGTASFSFRSWTVTYTGAAWANSGKTTRRTRSEEHTSELQSQSNLVCRLLLEKKKKKLKQLLHDMIHPQTHVRRENRRQ